MPTTNARKHVVPAPSDQSVTRASIFEAFGQSINDVIPVANSTERAQLITDLVNAGVGPTATRPVLVFRGDAPGLRRLEYTYNGTSWVPAAGKLSFASKSAADTWASSNPELLTIGDEARIANVIHTWDGARWNGSWEFLSGMSNGFTRPTGLDPEARRVGDTVSLRGELYRSSAPTSWQTVLTLPTYFRPTQIIFYATTAFGSGSNPTYVQVQPNGVVQVACAVAATASTNGGAGYSLQGPAWFVN